MVSTAGLIPADADNLLYAHMSQEILVLTFDGHGTADHESSAWHRPFVIRRERVRDTLACHR